MKKNWLVAFVLSVCMVFFCLGGTALGEGPAADAGIGIVTVEGGQVSGVQSDVDGVTVFKGIPYAADTSGENRWRAPQPVEPWEGVKVCDTWGDASAQPSLADVGMSEGFWHDESYFDEAFNPGISENGLNLNVYTPASSADEKLPVLVYIHGGGNIRGNGSEMIFYPAKIASKGIVVVSVQYRCTLFGFLALPGLSAESEHGVSGNYAMLDLVKSLQWVHDYISGFGGDPDNVTISGQSAGAGNVQGLLRTPLADGLFRNAAMFSSGNGLMTIAPYQKLEDAQVAQKAAIIAAMGLDENISDEDLVEELRSHDYRYYIETPSAKDGWPIYLSLMGAVSSYVEDGYVFTEESVNMTRPGAFDDIDSLILSTVADESTTGLTDDSGRMSLDDFAALLKETYGDNYDVTAYQPENEADAFALSLRMGSDQAHATSKLTAEYINANNDVNAYVFYFDHDLAPHANPNRNESIYGSYHTADMWYWMYALRDKEGQRLWTEGDYNVAEIMSSYLANFTKTGDPNGENLPAWPICDAANDSMFSWAHDGVVECVKHAYPEREIMNRELLAKDLIKEGSGNMGAALLEMMTSDD